MGKNNIAVLESNSTEVMQKQSFKDHLNMYYKFFFEKGEKYPKSPLPQKQLRVESIMAPKTGLNSVWLGHSSLLLNIDGTSVLTDPVFEKKVTLVGPARFNSKLPLELKSIETIDVVIISHNHYDHLNKFSIQHLKNKVKLFIVPQGVGDQLVGWGVSNTKVVELDWWQSHSVGENLTVTATPGQHFSGRGLFDRNKTLWASWVLKTEKHSVFFSGDTGYFNGFTEIGNKYGPFDVTYLECGAYNKNWSNVHMFPEETVQAFVDLRGKVLQPIHWATYNLSLHPWYEPIERLIKESNQRGVYLSVPMMGEIVNYENHIELTHWWDSAKKKNNPLVEESNVVLNEY